MKNRKVWKLILSVTLAAFLLWGCGSAEGEPAEEAGAAEVTAEESVIEEEKTEKTEKEEESVEEEPAAEEESVADEETSNDMPEAQVTTTVENFDGLVDYMVALDPETPHIVIYNEAEGYIIDMKEGEHYQLKKDDRIFLNVNSDYMKNVAYSMPDTSYQPISGSWEIIPDYSQFKVGELHYYDIYLSDNYNEYVEISCYLDPPIE
ncbi:MAG: hypothetical protein ACI4AA_08670 [Lachnospiraceae bacterium]